MDHNELVALYEKEIEVFLATMGIFKGIKANNYGEEILEDNFNFIFNKMVQLKSGNVDTDALKEAINNILPFLFEKSD